MADLAPSPALIAPGAMLGHTVSPASAQGRKVAEDFEASFLSALLQPMFAALETEGPFGGGQGEATFRSFLVDAMAKQTVRAGGIGIADVVQREMLKMQGLTETPPAAAAAVGAAQ